MVSDIRKNQFIYEYIYSNEILSHNVNYYYFDVAICNTIF